MHWTEIFKLSWGKYHDFKETTFCNDIYSYDFFAVATTDTSGFLNDQQVHAVLLDIDHSPSHWLKTGNSDFYSESSLTKMTNKLLPKGIFGLWSNEQPDQEFVELLNRVFCNTQAHVVSFANPYSGGESINSVYIASKRA